MNKYQLLIFDLDGTLLNSIEGIGTAMNAVLARHDFPLHKMESYYYFVGNGLKKLAERALPQSVTDIEPYYQELIVAYEKYYQEGLGLYPGIAELLDECSRRGLWLAVNSNKIDHMVKKIVADYYQKWQWVAALGAREGLAIKPSPEAVYELMTMTGLKKEQILYIGDSEVDVQTAKNAGVASVFVSWGFRKLEDLGDLKADYIIDRPEHLLSVLE